LLFVAFAVNQNPVASQTETNQFFEVFVAKGMQLAISFVLVEETPCNWENARSMIVYISQRY
jgi:hypothetical protein